jgi:hypothetical protein
MRFDPNLASAYYHATQICEKLGHVEEAQQYFVKFKEVSEKKH